MGNSALIVVDFQNDFCEGGALAVPGANNIMPVVRLLLDNLADEVIFTQDWHPANHGSFASVAGKDPFAKGFLNDEPQIFWPDHCVQDSDGAEFHVDIFPCDDEVVIQKGQDPAVDSYSGFANKYPAISELGQYLNQRKVDRVYICGLATDYCVKATALDAAKIGLETIVVVNACAGVDEKSTREALEEMRKAGIILL